MTDKEQDPNLQAPQESNTTKHINFIEVEETSGAARTDDNDKANGDENNPTKKAWEELRKDQQNEASS